MTNMSPTEPTIHLTKVTMTTILSQRKAGPWKRDIEKTKGTDSYGGRELPIEKSAFLKENCFLFYFDLHIFLFFNLFFYF